MCRGGVFVGHYGNNIIIVHTCYRDGPLPRVIPIILMYNYIGTYNQRAAYDVMIGNSITQLGQWSKYEDKQKSDDFGNKDSGIGSSASNKTTTASEFAEVINTLIACAKGVLCAAVIIISDIFNAKAS